MGVGILEKLYGLIGEKLGHTYSPQIHDEILKSINIEGHFGVLEVKKELLKDVIPGLKALNYKGITVTIPYKMDIIQFLDDISDEAKKIGAVNVVNLKDGKAIGYNTDYYGFGMTLKNYGIDITGEEAIILGTGGASRAVLQYLIDNGIKKVTFVSTNIESAKAKYPQYDVINYEQLEQFQGCSLIINCTPVGMYPKCDATPINKRYLKKFKNAVDIIYNPEETLFLSEAREQGLKTVNGMYMLVAQAVKAEEIWNDREIPFGIIDNIMEHMKAMI